MVGRLVLKLEFLTCSVIRYELLASLVSRKGGQFRFIYNFQVEKVNYKKEFIFMLPGLSCILGITLVISMDDDTQQSHLLHQDHFATFSPLLGASQTYTLFYNHTVLRTVVVGVFQSWSLLRKQRRRLFSLSSEG